MYHTDLLINIKMRALLRVAARCCALHARCMRVACALHARVYHVCLYNYVINFIIYCNVYLFSFYLL